LYEAVEMSRVKGESKKWVPLTAGKSQIQSEGAEIFYRDIRLKPINKLPDGETVE